MADPHIGFIVAAYAIAAVVIAAMIAGVVVDYRRLNASLRQATRSLEAARGGEARRP